VSDDRSGRAVFVSSWAANALFASTAVPVALDVEALEVPAVVVAIALFLVSLPVWAMAFVVAATRSARGEDVTLAGVFLVAPGAPRYARLHLYGALAVCLVIAAATAAADPFGVLVPMLSLGLVGLWGARHGRYPPRSAYPRGRHVGGS
jgi:hypothetical protein